jgi:hypothetical protein
MSSTFLSFSSPPPALGLHSSGGIPPSWSHSWRFIFRIFTSFWAKLAGSWRTVSSVWTLPLARIAPPLIQSLRPMSDHVHKTTNAWSTLDVCEEFGASDHTDVLSNVSESNSPSQAEPPVIGTPWRQDIKTLEDELHKLSLPLSSTAPYTVTTVPEVSIEITMVRLVHDVLLRKFR